MGGPSARSTSRPQKRARRERCRCGRRAGPRRRARPCRPAVRREPEDALADDVALDLVGSAGDPVAGSAEHVLAPPVGAPLTGVGEQVRARGRRPRHRSGQVLGPQELPDRTLRSGVWPSRRAAAAPARGQLRSVGGCTGRRAAPADHRIVREAEVAGERQHASCSQPVPAPVSGRWSARSRAWSVRPATAAPTSPSAQRRRGPHVGEEHLVEGRATGHLPERPDLDTGRVHRHQEHGQPLVLRHVGVGAGISSPSRRSCAPDVHTFCPLTHPLVAVRSAREVLAAEVGAGRGLREQLAHLARLDASAA